MSVTLNRMSDGAAVIIAVVVVIPGLVSAMFSGIAAMNSARSIDHTQALGKAINGRMQELIAASKDSGKVEEAADQHQRERENQS
jgi:hypothetical protein